MLNDISWRSFEALVYQIQRLNYRDAVVKFDERVTDKITNTKRQVDIAVHLEVDGVHELIVVECKHYQSKIVTHPHVEQFASFLNSVGASKGVLVGSCGFTKAARKYAEAMGISLYTIEEASGLEWNTFVREVTLPVIKKTIQLGNISFLASGREKTFTKEEILSGRIQIYDHSDGDFVSMDTQRKAGLYGGSFFYDMPNVLDFAIEAADEQVSTKLRTSKKIEYSQIEETIQREVGSPWVNSVVSFLIYDDLRSEPRNTNSLLTWKSWVMSYSKDVAEKRYLEIGQQYLSIDQYRFLYRATLTVQRSRSGRILSEADLSGGVAYVDVLSGTKQFHILSELLH